MGVYRRSPPKTRRRRWIPGSASVNNTVDFTGITADATGIAVVSAVAEANQPAAAAAIAASTAPLITETISPAAAAGVGAATVPLVTETISPAAASATGSAAAPAVSGAVEPPVTTTAGISGPLFTAPAGKPVAARAGTARVYVRAVAPTLSIQKTVARSSVRLAARAASPTLVFSAGTATARMTYTGQTVLVGGAPYPVGVYRADRDPTSLDLERELEEILILTEV